MEAIGGAFAAIIVRGFNSLQTGKRIQSPACKIDPSSYFFWSFNSLQTGKRIQRFSNNALEQIEVKRFNPLQTGKRIQSGWSQKKEVKNEGFNSLQTGKRIQRSHPRTRRPVKRSRLFQFPSNGKADPKVFASFVFASMPEIVSIPFKRGKRIKAK